jgi:Type II secretion system (T2SS), protein M subtype b
VTLSTRDQRALALLALGLVSVLVLRFGIYSDAPEVVGVTGSAALAEKRLARLREVAATVSGKETVLKQVRADLAMREAGILRAETAAQAQAQILQTARRLGTAEGIEMRGGEMGGVRAVGEDYGEVAVTVSFDCRIEQLVNLLAAVANEPDLVVTNSVRISAANPKEKTVSARVELTGLVPRKLVPERKGLGSF